jgi:hypothetical protein
MMRRKLLSIVVVAGASLGLMGGSVAVANASGHGPGWYGVTANGVAVRQETGEECSLYPGPTTCPNVLYRVNAGQQVNVVCQNGTGAVVGGNPYWVWVNAAGQRAGWMASYYTNNASNRIDGVPDC